MAIELEKILTVSAEAYAASVGKDLSMYELRGVHVVEAVDSNGINLFAAQVPDGAEAVVDYRARIYGSGVNLYSASGTALVPLTAEQVAARREEQMQTLTETMESLRRRLGGDFDIESLAKGLGGDLDDNSGFPPFNRAERP